MDFTTSDGIRLAFEYRPPRDRPETVAFFNGVMASMNSWMYAAPLFERFGYGILLHDFRGQLLSEKPEGPYAFARHALDAVELMDHLGIDTVHLVGTSYGGEVAMKMAVDSPTRVTSLSIINSVSELDDALKSRIQVWIENTKKLDVLGFFEAAIPGLYGEEFLRARPDFLAEVRARSQVVPPEFLDGQLALYETFLLDLNLTPDLAKITCPTLIVCGQDDQIKPLHFSDIIHRAIPHSEFVVFPHCGHVTIYEQPEALNSALLGFITKHGVG